ncbi:hypothetical protein CYY_006536 [Polysphondylium violaceum]|uniref:Ribosome biogenesis protein BOP1 homolog n=1 Tax=Polysphondylium violaceum TaxID=133409 RepID=A0A8J4PQE9_9MYCE|nr:hypothetical protein CYY_006536 [Polysphondylium violaceum]
MAIDKKPTTKTTAAKKPAVAAAAAPAKKDEKVVAKKTPVATPAAAVKASTPVKVAPTKVAPVKPTTTAVVQQKQPQKQQPTKSTPQPKKEPVIENKRKTLEESEDEEEEEEDELDFGEIREDISEDEGDDEEDLDQEDQDESEQESESKVDLDSLVEYRSDDEEEEEEESIKSNTTSSKSGIDSSEDEDTTVIGKKWTSDPNQFYDDEDSSEDESLVNRVGNIPLEWYEDYDHIGYDVDGNKIMKTESNKDSIDKFLDQADPNFWRTVYDKVNDKNVLLSPEDMALLKNIQNRQFPPDYDPYEFWYDPGPNPDSIHPMHNAPRPKRSFFPHGTDEEREIRRLTKLIRAGWITFDKKDKKTHTYDIWGEGAKTDEVELNQDKHKAITRIPAPKQRLPGNVESFNPPEEYLLTDNEMKAWHLMDPRERPHNFIPQKYNFLRHIPTYNKLIKERFERCLDLYLCPRTKKVKQFTKDANQFLPKLPKPQDLRPFPSHEEIQFNGHTDRVRTISVSPNGQWLASGSNDNTVRIWEVSSTRCVYTLQVDNEVQCVAWNPNPLFNILAIAHNNKVVIITPPLYGPANLQTADTERILTKPDAHSSSKNVDWYAPSDSASVEKGVRLELHLAFKVVNITWHFKGDYFSTTSPEEGSKSVKIHHLSKRASQSPFRRSKTPNQVSKFHPTKPIFFVADQNIIRVYDLMKQELIKKLITGCRYISSIDIHPGGDNVIMSGYDKKVCWFDLDLSVKPYKVLNYHKLAVRKVIYHPTLPLFASCSDDLSIHIFHGMVYDDLLQNALIVPLKILKTHQSVNDLGVLDIAFHPKQPWIFSSGADSTIRLYI